jgi:hypothetical protein
MTIGPRLNQAAMDATQYWRTRMFAHTSSLRLATVLAAVSLFNIAGEAWATMRCGNHNDVAKALTAKYKETRRAMGVVSSKAVMEIFMSPQGTWTILVTDTTGKTCITAAGEEWQDVPVAMAGLDS